MQGASKVLATGSPKASPVVGVVGASARAAVGSLARAGFASWAVDLFADRDLVREAPTRRVPLVEWPQGIAKLAEEYPPGPVLYVGGIENHPSVVASLSQSRPLWGNDVEVLARVRDPFFLEAIFRSHHLPFASVLPLQREFPTDRRWLVKPRKGTGGLGIALVEGANLANREASLDYLQEFIDGVPMSAIFVSNRRQTSYLGATEQLIGEESLHSSGFHYCGTIGPAVISLALREQLEKLGEVIATSSGLLGLWGIDFILKDDVPYPVEVNPRYTAAVEVLELAKGEAYMRHHAECFSESVAESPACPQRRERVIAKAIYFAPKTIRFPNTGPWDSDLAAPRDPWILPGYADIPAAGEEIPMGAPVLTFFDSGATSMECRARLQENATKLDLLIDDQR